MLNFYKPVKKINVFLTLSFLYVKNAYFVHF